MARLLVVVGSAGFVGLIAALTLLVIAGHGLDPLTALSLGLVALIAIGVLGALLTRSDGD